MRDLLKHSSRRVSRISTRFTGLERAIVTLEEDPTRYPVTPENTRLRHLLYGKKPHIYRVIYAVAQKHKGVDILHIRHGARQAFVPGDVGNSR